MPSQFVISDLVLIPLEQANGRLSILRERDHVLRRFGMVEVVDLPVGDTNFNLRAEADEVWAALSGAVDVILVDLRPASPSGGERQTLVLDSASPQALLIPFGVTYAFSADAPARLLRLATHSETQPGDRQGDLAALLAELLPGARQ